MNYENVMKLALERAFYFPSCEIYGDAQAGFWEYGPTGVSVKNKFLELWRRELVRRDRMIEIDGSQIMSKSVFEASGHLGNFSDPIIKCKKCGSTFRADKLISDVTSIEIPESAELEYFDKILNEYLGIFRLFLIPIEILPVFENQFRNYINKIEDGIGLNLLENSEVKGLAPPSLTKTKILISPLKSGAG